MRLHPFRHFVHTRLLSKARGSMQQHTRWYIRVRWYFLLAIGIPGILSNVVGEGISLQVRRDAALLSVALLSNLVIFIISRYRQKDVFYRKVLLTLIAIDLVTITLLIFIKGGIESRALILYVIPMLMSSAIFGSSGVYRVAIASIVLYDGLIFLDWAGVISTINAVNPSLSSNTTYVVNTVAFFTSVLLIVSSLADFITRQVVEKELAARESLEALEAAQEVAKLGSWAWNIPEDIVTWSTQMHHIMGTDPKRFKGNLAAYTKLIHDDDKRMVIDTIEESLHTIQPFTFEHRIKTGDGPRWIHADGKITADAAGHPVRAYGTVQDITESKQFQQAAARRTKEMEKLNAVMVDRELKMIELKRELEKARRTHR